VHFQGKKGNKKERKKKKKKTPKKELLWRINEVQFCIMFLERNDWIRNDFQC